MKIAASGAASDAPRARPVYFGPADAALFGWYHAPLGPPREASVVLCAPIGVEAIFAHRALRHIAERLARDGFAVLRYDHHGTGDSSGTGTEADRVRVWTDGIATAADTIRKVSGVRHIALVGLRFGAALATLAATAAHADALVLWAPTVSGRQYSRELRAFAQMGGAPENGGVGGFYFAPETFAAISEIDLARVAGIPARHALIIPRDDRPPAAEPATHLRALGVDVTTVDAPGFAAAVAEPHNTKVPDAVVGAIAAWLAALYPSAEAIAPPDTAPLRDSLLTRGDVAADGTAVQARERAIFLDTNHRLVGILAEPEGIRRRGTAIVLINAGAVSRVGPNRLYVAMAREWAALGYPVLRMDLGGIGDSINAPDIAENHTYPPTALGDIVAGIDALRAIGETRFVVAGLCSGAHATFHIGADRAGLAGVAGLIMINPIVFYWKEGDALDVSSWENYAATRWYQQRAGDPRAWLRLIKGQVNLAAAAMTVGRRVATVAGAAGRRIAARWSAARTEDLARDLLAMTARPLTLLMVFSEGDPGHDQLQLHAGHALRRLGRRSNFQLVSIPAADHTFTQLDAQRRLRELLQAHLTSHFE